MQLDLQKIIKSHKVKSAEYRRLYDLYKGKHPILNKEQKENKPNNKLVNNYYKHIIDSGLGYWLGKPVSIQHHYSDRIQEVLDRIFSDNEINDLFSEIAKETAIKSRSYAFVYQDEAGFTHISRVPAEEVALVKVGKKVTHAVRYYSELNVEGENENWVEVLDAESIKLYKESGGGFVLIDETPHIFGRVPIATSLNNEEENSDIHDIESLVNSYNEALSNLKDDMDAYKNAVFFTKNIVWDEETTARFAESYLLEAHGELGLDVDARIISKEIKMDATKTFLDTIERNIHKFSSTPDMSDENFGGASSGIAIKQKLLLLEAKIGTKERKFTRFIKELLELIGVVIYVETGEEVRTSDFDIHFKHSLPTNDVEIIDKVIKLNGTGLVDKETLISWIPEIDNAMAILEKVEAEKKAEENALYPNMHVIEQV